MPAVRMISVWPIASARDDGDLLQDQRQGGRLREARVEMVKTMTGDDEHQQRADRRVGVQQMLDALDG